MGLRHSELSYTEFLAKDGWREGRPQVEDVPQLPFDRCEKSITESGFLQSLSRHTRAVTKPLSSHDILLNSESIALRITQPAKGIGDSVVDDSQRSSTGECLVLYERELGLYTCGVCTHDQSYCPSRGYHRGLGVPEPMLLAIHQGPVPAAPGRVQEILGALLRIDPHGGDRQALVLRLGCIVCGPPVVTHYLEHVLRIPLVVGEWPEYGCHLRASGVTLAAHYRG